jgi:hypothetical protein
MTQAEYSTHWVSNIGFSFGAVPSMSFSTGYTEFHAGEGLFIGAMYNTGSLPVDNFNYQLEIKVGGNFANGAYFGIMNGPVNTVYNINQAGTYRLPFTMSGSYFEVRYNDVTTTYTNPGLLFYVKLLAPQTSNTERIMTPYGIMEKPHNDGKEDFNGELKGTNILTTAKTRTRNPFLDYMYTSGSTI